jgi:gluconate 5-dehydrogenase
LHVFALTGKSALVSGAGRGTRLAIAQALARAGASVTLAGSSREVLEACVKELSEEGFQARALALEMSEADSIGAVVAGIDTPDILVNVPGTNACKRIIDDTGQVYDRFLTTDLSGLAALTLKVGARMIQRGHGGKIINIGRPASLAAYPYVSVEAITTGPVGKLTGALAAEWAHYNIQVNCIAPGFLLTDLIRPMLMREDLPAWIRANQTNPRSAGPHDIAALSVFLAGHGSDYITGQIIPINGRFRKSIWPFQSQ